MNVTRLGQTSIWLLLAFALVLLRLGYITLWQNEASAAMAQNQRLSTIDEIEYRRGDFLDRHGQPLTNRSENVLLVWPDVLRRASGTDDSILAPRLQALLRQHGLQSALTGSIRRSLAARQPFILARGLLPGQMTSLQKELADTDGIYALTLRPRYTTDTPAVHLLGYAAADSHGEYHGQTGLEKQYDSVLSGRTSARIALPLDERGQATGTLRYIPADSASQSLNIRLTIDQSYQAICEEALGQRPGAVVLLDSQNGDVLAMASAPTYDPYAGQPPTDGDIYLNKALSYFPPASVFKTVLTLAALDNGITLDDRPEAFTCTGSITLPGGHSVNCWKNSGHGSEDLCSALGNSCNPYFVALGQQLGGELITEYAYRLGFGEQILQGIDTATQPNPDFNTAVPADVANISIGERGVRATPLMLARLMATIANGGKMPTPRLVSALQTEQGAIIQEFPTAAPRQVVKTSSANQLRRFLTEAVQNGTGRPVASSLINIGGKTGTSQNFGVWFAGFFPADAPRWAIAVYIADGESGGGDAGSVCREIAEKIALLEDIANRSAV
ncbi:MAG: penicillin-binding protein 2 [Firmicutes bacterium]|nr:penicillin-binding protein 2 [Bacillota bacterium]